MATDQANESGASELKKKSLFQLERTATWRRIVLVVALVTVALALLLMLVARRYTEAKTIADANIVLRDITGRLRYETLRQPREVLEGLANSKSSVTAGQTLPDPVAALSSAGFHITIAQKGQLVSITTGRKPVQPNSRNPTLQVLSEARYFLADGRGSYLFPVAWQDKIRIGKILGVSPTDVYAAVQVQTDELKYAARGILMPGVELTIFRNGASSVKIVRNEGTDVLLDTTQTRLPDEVWQDDSHPVDLSNGLEWPRFLLFGGNEVNGFQVHDQVRGGNAYRVVYLKDSGETPDRWSGVEFAYPSADEIRDDPWKASYVGITALSYFLICAFLLAIRRLGIEK